MWVPFQRTLMRFFFTSLSNVAADPHQPIRLQPGQERLVGARHRNVGEAFGLPLTARELVPSPRGGAGLFDGFFLIIPQLALLFGPGLR